MVPPLEVRGREKTPKTLPNRIGENWGRNQIKSNGESLDYAGREKGDVGKTRDALRLRARGSHHRKIGSAVRFLKVTKKKIAAMRV